VSSPPETQRGPAANRPTTYSDDDASLLPTPDELRDRFAAQVERAMRRRDAERADRAERQARRRAGKALLHGGRRRGGR
jgi:hypothetical protein